MSKGTTDNQTLELGAIARLVVDVVLVQQLIRFRDGIVALRTAWNQGHKEDHAWCARELCKGSREIRFQLGPPEDSHPKAVMEIIDLFHLAAESIHADPNDPADKDLAVYKKNIAERARLIEARLDQPK